MNTTTQTRDALGVIIHTLVSGSYPSIEATPEEQLTAAFAAGHIDGIGPATGTFVNALMAAYRDDPLEGLAGIRAAVSMGFNPRLAQQALELTHAALDEELKTATLEEVRQAFNVENLATLRCLEALVGVPRAPLQGREFDIVIGENRPLFELQGVFGEPFVRGMPTEADAVHAHLESLHRVAADPGVDAHRRALALVELAAVAVIVDDLPTAVSLVAKALNANPVTDEALTAAALMWVMVYAQARDETLTEARQAPRWLDLVAVLRGALAYEVRHPPTAESATVMQS